MVIRNHICTDSIVLTNIRFLTIETLALLHWCVLRNFFYIHHQHFKCNTMWKISRRKGKIPKVGTAPAASRVHQYIDSSVYRYDTSRKSELGSQENVPEILFVIVRSKNYNTICFEALVDTKTKVEKTETFFLVLDPAFCDENVLSKEEFKREQLTYHEQQIYGVTKQSDSDDGGQVYTFNFMPSFWSFTVDPKTSEAKMEIDGEMATLEKVYLVQKDRFVGGPRVTQVILYGRRKKVEVTEVIDIH